MNCYKELQIVNQLGLHARAAAKFVKTAARFSSEIIIYYKNHQANGKSIMGVMMLGLSKGETLTLSITGIDCEDAMDALTQLITDKFGEPA
jgi:phosphocarrier protein HPr